MTRTLNRLASFSLRSSVRLSALSNEIAYRDFIHRKQKQILNSYEN